MDIIGPFSPGKGQTKHLLVIVDYFTKWIEVEPLATISARNVQNFVRKNIVCQFEVLGRQKRPTKLMEIKKKRILLIEEDAIHPNI